MVKYGLYGLWRNSWLSITAVSIMVITLLILSSLLVLSQLANVSAEDLRNRVDISVFFQDNVDEVKIQEIKADFGKIEEIQSLAYIPADQALSEFKARHQKDPLVQQTLDALGENPLQAMIVIKAKSLDDYPVIYKQLLRSRFEPLITKINYEDVSSLIETLQKITGGIQRVGAVIAGVFGLVAVLVIFNTLRLTIFNRKEEIEIMRLVGASNSYIRGPFLIEGILYGLIGTIFASILFFPVLKFSTPWITKFFQLDLPASTYFHSGYWQIIAIQAASGIILGVISSIIATRRHLKV